MIELLFYHQSIQAVGLPTIIFGRLCTTSPDLLQSSVLPPINNGLGGPDGTRKTSEDVDQGASGCRPGLPCQNALAHQEQGHLPTFSESRPEGQGDSLPDLEDGHRCPRPDRPGHPSGRHSEQGPVRSSHPHERGPKDRTSRVCRNGLDADQHLLDPERKVEGDVAASHRQLVLAMVPARRLRRLFESQRPAHFYYQYREEDLDRWRVPPGCPDVGRSHEPSDHAALHRSQPGSAGPDRRTHLTDGESETPEQRPLPGD